MSRSRRVSQRITVEEVPVPGTPLSFIIWKMPADNVWRDNPEGQQALPERTMNGSSPDRFLRVKEVEKLTGLSRTTIWRQEREGKFPKRDPISKNRVAWRESEINAWIAKRRVRGG